MERESGQSGSGLSGDEVAAMTDDLDQTGAQSDTSEADRAAAPDEQAIRRQSPEDRS